MSSSSTREGDTFSRVLATQYSPPTCGSEWSDGSREAAAAASQVVVRVHVCVRNSQGAELLRASRLAWAHLDVEVLHAIDVEGGRRVPPLAIPEPGLAEEHLGARLWGSSSSSAGVGVSGSGERTGGGAGGGSAHTPWARCP